jgi:alkylation response protein AidB-like acyl-CoA dehydrogenase
MASLAAEERAELRATAQTLLARESPSEKVRAVIADEPGFDRTLWDRLVELGWTGIHVPEQYGGIGAGYAELAVVLQELGGNIVPSPFLSSAVLATGALILGDNTSLARELVAPLVSGVAFGSVAMASTHGSYEVSRLTSRWDRVSGGVRLEGSSGFVPDADLANVLIVAARNGDGDPAVVAVDTATPGVVVERVASVDATRRLFRVTFEGVVVDDGRLLCDAGPPAEELLRHILAVGVIATACDAAGAAESVLELATSYAKERVQFGKPIGSFQAVKHHCANMAIAVEASRAAVDGAARALDGDRGAWPAAAAVTSSYVGPACSGVCDVGLRVHGGIGFTWEHDSHLYLKRAKLDEVLFGTPSWHRRRLASMLLAEVVTSGRQRL